MSFPRPAKSHLAIEKWIFADIEESYNPDILLDICNMSKIESASVDVINATEIFEHVDDPQKGLEECYRVLKKDGTMILSAPFLFPIHADPYDYQRWTEYKWKQELKNCNFKIEKFELMGRFFTVMADMMKTLIKQLPFVIRIFLKLFYPVIDLTTKLDNRKINSASALKQYTTGYFIIARK